METAQGERLVPLVRKWATTGQGVAMILNATLRGTALSFICCGISVAIILTVELLSEGSISIDGWAVLNIFCVLTAAFSFTEGLKIRSVAQERAALLAEFD